MKRSAIWSALILCLSLNAFAEGPRKAADAVEPEKPAEVIEQNPAVRKPVAVSLELLGKGLIYSLNVDVTIGRLFGIGGGFMYFPLTFSGLTLTSSGTVTAGGSTTIHTFVLPVYGTFTPNEGTHRFQIVAGTDLSFAAAGNLFSFGINPLVGLGYEARTNAGFIFRATLYAIASLSPRFSVLPWFGLSLGWAF